MLYLLEVISPVTPHSGEVYGCAFTSDGTATLSGGWDGLLRVWDPATGEIFLDLDVSPKPLSCCACSPDGLQWLVGTMEGNISVWDGSSQQQILAYTAHTRPVSSIAFSPDGQSLVTASWDHTVVLRKLGKEKEGKILSGHQDIVTGARFSTDGKNIISWSHDGSIKIWDAATGRDLFTLFGHGDRVTSLWPSPDGASILSGSRDGTIRTWDLDTGSEIATVGLGAEVVACFYLPDNESIIAVDAAGRLFLMSVPSFQVQCQLQTNLRVMCGDLSPNGTQLALGTADGMVQFVLIEGLESAALLVTPTVTMKEHSTLFGRLLGQTRTTKFYVYTCPGCRAVTELTSLPPMTNCPKCRRRLRLNQRVAQP
jgi:WD40 repeat protein